MGTLRILLQERPDLIDSQVLTRCPDQLEDEHLDTYLHNHSEVSAKLPDIDEGSSALHVAFKHDCSEVVDYLLEQGADLTVLDRWGLSPAVVAATVDNQVISMSPPRHFEGHPSPPSRNGSLAVSPMSKRFLRGTSQGLLSRPSNLSTLETALNIVKSQAELGKVSTRGTNTLHVRIRRSTDQEIQSFCVKCKERSPDLFRSYSRMQDEVGRTPLHLAVEARRLGAVTILLTEDPATLNMQDDHGRTPLYLALESEWSEGIEEILFHDPDMSVRCGERRETVLHLAARTLNSGNSQTIATLLALSTQQVRQERDGDEKLPVERAVESGNVDFLKSLLDSYGEEMLSKKLELLTLAVRCCHSESLDTVQFLIKSLPIEVADINSTPILHIAVRKDACLEFLLQLKGINVTKRSPEGRTILHEAADVGSTTEVKMILRHPDGPKLISTRDVDGREPVVTAALKGNIDVVVLLLKNGANLAAKDSSGRTTVDAIFCNGPQLDWVIDEVYDSFMETSETGNKNPAVTLYFRGLLANVRGDGRQLGVVEAIIKSGQNAVMQKFFLHPIVESFLFLKWKLLYKFYNFTILLYMAQIFSITNLSLALYSYESTPEIVWISRVVVWCTTVPIIILDLLLSRLELGYLSDLETWIRLGVVVSSGVLSMQSVPALRPLGAAAVLLAWIELLYLNSNSPSRGLRVLMFFEVARNVFQVLSTFIFLLLGFAFSFLILFNGAAPFTDMWSTWCKVLVMMVELEYGDAFDPALEATTIIVGRILFIGFMLLVVMVLNNLIMGMSVSDVAELEAQGRYKKLAKEASFLMTFEKLCYREDWLNKLPSFASTYVRKYRKVGETLTISSNENFPANLWNSVREKLHKREEKIKEDYIYTSLNEICKKLEISNADLNNTYW